MQLHDISQQLTFLEKTSLYQQPMKKSNILIHLFCTNLWNNEYQKSTTGVSYRSLFPSVNNITKSSSTVTFRLRTGHCLLNKHLHRIGLHATGLCSNCHVQEDIEHFLLFCPNYYAARNELRNNLNHLNLKMSLATILSDEAESFLIQFIKSINTKL